MLGGHVVPCPDWGGTCYRALFGFPTALQIWAVQIWTAVLSLPRRAKMEQFRPTVKGLKAFTPSFLFG